MMQTPWIAHAPRWGIWCQQTFHLCPNMTSQCLFAVPATFSYAQLPSLPQPSAYYIEEKILPFAFTQFAFPFGRAD